MFSSKFMSHFLPAGIAFIMMTVLTPLVNGGEPVEKAAAILQAREHWAAIEPGLFAAANAKKLIGEYVSCSGTPPDPKSPQSFKTASGITVKLTKLQPADLSEWKTFRKPPTDIEVSGPILAIDPATRTVTIKAVSTSFGK